MKTLVIVLVVLISVALVGALGVGGWWVMSRKTTTIPSPTAIVQAAPIPITESFSVPAGFAKTWTFSLPQGKTPGRFQGRWQSFGLGHHLKGATDDTLVGFEIKGSDDKMVQKTDHEAFGNFDFRYTGGNVTFVFDNAGVIRSSPRDVVLTGNYVPE